MMRQGWGRALVARKWTATAIAGAGLPVLLLSTAHAQWTQEAEKCYSAIDKPEMGIVHCTKAIEKGGLSDENLAITYSNRGNSFFDLGNLERAIEDYNKALQLNPDDTVTLSNRGAAYIELKRYDEALEDFSRAVALEPANYVALSNRCWVLVLKNKLDTALADCNSALELSPNDPFSLSSRAVIHMKQGRMDEALADSNRAVEFGRQVWEAFFYRGLVHEAAGNSAAARADFERARELAPGRKEIQSKLEALAEVAPSESSGEGAAPVVQPGQEEISPPEEAGEEIGEPGQGQARPSSEGKPEEGAG
jgi:tetratricopeptide (TPR) repeat protein